jgi:predicted metal-binding membrane protein
MMSEPACRQTFFGVLALLFAASVVLTIVSCLSMQGMSDMPMPGGWTMSMVWMQAPGQSWLGAASSFLGEWMLMMMAMMLPSLVPTLWRQRQAFDLSGADRLGWLTTMVGAGYFFVWALFGVMAFVFGGVLAAVLMQQPTLARAVPMAAGVVVLIAGAVQFTAWKARQLACCRATFVCRHRLPAHFASAWRQGLQLGLHCCLGCSGLSAVLLVIGVMDLRVMAATTVAVTAERLAPAGRHASAVIGVVIVVAGLLLLVRAVGRVE